MEGKKTRRLSARVQAARERWRRHVSAQRRSGKSQVAYCREHDLDPRYFSVWKGKLARAAHGSGVRHRGATATLVPVRITGTVAPAEAPRSDARCELTARLPNGVMIEVRAGSAHALTALVGELARLPC
jgi:hypothetical protein